MGITHLESFLEEDWPNEYCYKEDIEALARHYQKQTGKIPVLVVDATYFIHHYYLDNYLSRDCFFGGQLREFKNFVHYFVEYLQSLGLKPVFYFDGPTVDTKMDCRKMRNNHKLQKIRNLLENLHKPYKELFRWTTLPVLISATSRFILKYECGCDVFVSIKECDEELAAYANRESCFAILSQDSDFMCLKNGVYYLSIKHMNLERKTTLLYDRGGLMKYFSFTTHQMRLYASLLGNEIVTLSKLKNFHNSLCDSKNYSKNPSKNSSKFLKVAEYVRKETFNCSNNVEQALPSILSHVNMVTGCNLDEAIRASLRSYLPSEEESWISEVDIDDDWVEILEVAHKKHVECEAIPDVYATLTGVPYEVGLFLEDHTLNENACQIFLPIRQWIYSILLHEKPREDTPHCVKEFGMWNGKWHGAESIQVPELPEDVHHPGLISLWTKDSQRIKRQRRALFARSISPKLNPLVFHNLKHHYVVPVAVCFFLKHEWKDSYLEDWEFDAFILQAVSVLTLEIEILQSIFPYCWESNGSRALNGAVCDGKGCIGSPDKRLMNVATLFGYGISMVLFLMSSLGIPLKNAMPWYYFDGPLFRHYYHSAMQNKVELQQRIHRKFQFQVMEDFKVIREIIHMENAEHTQANSILNIFTLKTDRPTGCQR